MSTDTPLSAASWNLSESMPSAISVSPMRMWSLRSGICIRTERTQDLSGRGITRQQLEANQKLLCQRYRNPEVHRGTPTDALRGRLKELHVPCHRRQLRDASKRRGKRCGKALSIDAGCVCQHES